MAQMIQPQDSNDACRALEYLIHDLIVAHQLYDFFADVGKDANVHSEAEKAVRRMYISHLLLALQKFSEFYGKYKWLLPEPHKAECRAIQRELTRRQVRDVRNTFIGHILDKKTNRPISNSDVDAAFNRATNNDLRAFLSWIHVSGNTASPATVVGALAAAQATLRKAHGI
jgi:hypothetical protein